MKTKTKAKTKTTKKTKATAKAAKTTPKKGTKVSKAPAKTDPPWFAQASKEIGHDFIDAIDGLHAYYCGFTDAGFHDESLKQRIADYLRSLNETDRRVLLARAVRELLLSEQAIDNEYGLEDVRDIIDWLDQVLGAFPVTDGDDAG